MKLPTKQATKIDHIAAGNQIRNARNKRGMSLRKLAVRLGCSAPYLSDLELGRRNWSEERFEQAVKILTK